MPTKRRQIATYLTMDEYNQLRAIMSDRAHYNIAEFLRASFIKPLLSGTLNLEEEHDHEEMQTVPQEVPEPPH